VTIGETLADLDDPRRSRWWRSTSRAFDDVGIARRRSPDSGLELTAPMVKQRLDQEPSATSRCASSTERPDAWRPGPRRAGSQCSSS
jgi:hypothetical protein